MGGFEIAGFLWASGVEPCDFIFEIPLFSKA
jgi:hypothetical protein